VALAFLPGEVCVFVPARMGSTRLPGKPLADVAGLPLIVRVMKGLEGPWGVLAAVTDSPEVAAAAEDAGYRALLTGPAPSGTHRVRLAWEALGSPGRLVVNMQGDEPMADASWIEALASVDPGDGVCTLAREAPAGELAGPDSVKVVTGAGGRALYFSRSPIPHGAGRLLEHVGAYAFTPDSLTRCTDLMPSHLSRTERLEQLAWLEAGVPITVVTGDFAGLGVDAPEDLARASAVYSEMEGSSD